MNCKRELIILFLYFIFGRFEDNLFCAISDHDKNKEMDTYHSEMKDVQPEDRDDDLFCVITEYKKKKGKEIETKYDEPDDGDDDEMKAWLLMKKKSSTQKKAEWDRGVAKGQPFFSEIIQPWMDMEVWLHELGTDGLMESELEGIEETDKEQEEVEKHIEEMEADE